jgi:GT2 family glycosyltransferase
MTDAALGVVISRERPHLLPAACASVARYGPNDALVIDSGSRPETEDVIRAAAEPYPVTFLRRNAGYSGAANVGLEEAARRRAHCLLMTDDAELAEGSWGRLADALRAGAGVAGPTTAHATARSGGFRLRGRLASVAVRADGGSHDCDWLPGSTLAIHRDVVLADVRFDEGLFAYGEDVDFCLRVRRLGKPVRWVADAVAYEREGPRGAGRIVAEYLNARNRLALVGRYVGKRAVVVDLVAREGRDMARVLLGSSDPWTVREARARARLLGAADYLRRRMGEPDPVRLIRGTPPT